MTVDITIKLQKSHWFLEGEITMHRKLTHSLQNTQSDALEQML